MSTSRVNPCCMSGCETFCYVESFAAWDVSSRGTFLWESCDFWDLSTAPKLGKDTYERVIIIKVLILKSSTFTLGLTLLLLFMPSRISGFILILDSYSAL